MVSLHCILIAVRIKTPLKVELQHMLNLTLAVALHATGSVDGISKETVAWHLLPHDAGTHRA